MPSICVLLAPASYMVRLRLVDSSATLRLRPARSAARYKVMGSLVAPGEDVVVNERTRQTVIAVMPGRITSPCAALLSSATARLLQRRLTAPTTMSMNDDQLVLRCSLTPIALSHVRYLSLAEITVTGSCDELPLLQLQVANYLS
jgi:hypothetical protein